MSENEDMPWYDFDYAYLQVVPHVHLGDRETVGAVLHSRTSGFIGLVAKLDIDRIQLRWPELDIEMLKNELDALNTIAKGEGGSEISTLTPSERFHWITAPRSAVVQLSSVHAGRSKNPEQSLADLVVQIG